jgi:hypothetical protein
MYHAWANLPVIGSKCFVCIQIDGNLPRACRLVLDPRTCNALKLLQAPLFGFTYTARPLQKSLAQR